MGAWSDLLRVRSNYRRVSDQLLTRSRRFLYGFPPFHDDTPEKVFANILSRKIDWHEGEIDISDEARDFMERLLCSDSNRRLGAQGTEEVKAHPFLADIEWDQLLEGEVDFVPKISDPESTEYFDPRGAVAQVFEEAVDQSAETVVPASTIHHVHAVSESAIDQVPTETRRTPRERSETEPSPHEDFGAFNFRNLPILKQANDAVIRKMRDEQMKSISPLMVDSTSLLPILSRSVAIGNVVGKTKARASSLEFGVSPFQSSIVPSEADRRLQHPANFTASPSESSGSGSSGQEPLPAMGALGLSTEAFPRKRPASTSIGSADLRGHNRRNSMPSRLRTTSMSDFARPPLPEAIIAQEVRRRASGATAPLTATQNPERPPLVCTTHLSSTPAISPSASSGVTDRVRTIDCLVAGKNPITNKVLETMLVRLGCRCVVVPDGGEAILAANSVRFDIIWMDLQMSPINGEKAARMIKSTRSMSMDSLIVAVCSYDVSVDDELGTLFAATLSKPISKGALLQVMRKLNFAEAKSKWVPGQERRGSGGELLSAVSSRRPSAEEKLAARRISVPTLGSSFV